MNICTLVIHHGKNLVEPVWDFLSREIASDEFLRSYVNFMDEYYRNEVYNMTNFCTEHGGIQDTMVFETFELYTIVEFLRYVLYSYNKKNDMSGQDLDKIIESSTIYVFDNYQDAVAMYLHNENRALVEIKVSVERQYMMPRPDYPYRSYWSDRTLKRLVMHPVSSAREIDKEIYAGMFENVWIEQLDLTFNEQIDAMDIKNMFINTRCRTIECTFLKCDDDYSLTTAPFSNIDFKYVDNVQFSGSAYVEFNYKRENTGAVDNKRLFINL